MRSLPGPVFFLLVSDCPCSQKFEEAGHVQGLAEQTNVISILWWQQCVLMKAQVAQICAEALQ